MNALAAQLAGGLYGLATSKNIRGVILTPYDIAGLPLGGAWRSIPKGWTTFPLLATVGPFPSSLSQ